MQAGQGSAVHAGEELTGQQPGVWIGVTISTLSQVSGLQRAVLVADRRLEDVGRGDGLDGAAAVGAGDVSGDGLRVGGDRATAGEQGIGRRDAEARPLARIGLRELHGVQAGIGGAPGRSRRHWPRRGLGAQPGLPK